MAKGNTKKSFLDYFKLSDSSDDDFDDDLFDEDEDDYEDEDDMDDRLDDEYDDEDDYDAPQTESRVKASPLKSFNKYKGSASSDNGSARSKAARSSHGQQSGAGNGKLVSINSRSRAMDDSEVFVIKPDVFQAISGNIFLATPNGTYVSGDLREELAGGSLQGETLSSKATY